MPMYQIGFMPFAKTNPLSSNPHRVLQSFELANIEISIQYSIVLYNVDHFVEIATN